jgi:putative transposase
LDATYLKVRDPDLHQVVSKAVVVATGITTAGDGEVLGLAVGDSEAETFWAEFLRSLRNRGLNGVRLVVSTPTTGSPRQSGATCKVPAGSAHQCTSAEIY